MTIDELKIIIANGEHQQLELKKTTGELKDPQVTSKMTLKPALKMTLKFQI